MTLLPRWWLRSGLLKGIPTETRFFRVASESVLMTKCHWQSVPQHHDTLLLVHGLEGCTESHYMRGIAHKAWRAKLNVIRINQRNCGGTEHLTPTLYNGGLSGDLRAIVDELATSDKLDRVWVAGYSMGGNLALKLLGEAGDSLPALQGGMAVCPNIHPAACVRALQRPRNFIYHRYFLTRLKERLTRKARFFPDQWDLSRLPAIRTLWEFDDVYTAPDGGYHDAAEYYERSGARHLLDGIRRPTLIITAQDDPFIPYETFDIAALKANRHIQFLAPPHGGHCGFLERHRMGEDGFWAENQIIEFIASHRSALRI